MTIVVLEGSGEIVRFVRTPEYFAEIEQLRTEECNEHQTFRCRFPTASGFQTRLQCSVCGKRVGTAIKREAGDENLPLYRPELAQEYEARKESLREQILQKHARLQFEKENGWFRDHNKYLASEAWKAKRALVLKRAGGMCEGCGLAAATQVHHLTYAHHKNEFLFELVAVCDGCHERLHEPETMDSEETPYDDASDEGDDIFLEHPCNGCRFASDDNGSYECTASPDGYEPVEFALSEGGTCGVDRRLYEPLK